MLNISLSIFSRSRQLPSLFTAQVAQADEKPTDHPNSASLFPFFPVTENLDYSTIKAIVLGETSCQSAACSEENDAKLVEINTNLSETKGRLSQLPLGEPRRRAFEQFMQHSSGLLNYMRCNQEKYLPDPGASAVFRADSQVFIDTLSVLTPSEKQHALNFANEITAFLPDAMVPDITQAFADRIITTLYTSPTYEDRMKLWANLQQGFALLAGIPFHLGGYVTRNGSITGNGINCISYANILINLSMGIPVYDPNVGGMTSPDMFSRKKEFMDNGIRQQPVITQYPLKTGSTEGLMHLLDNYGSLYCVQIYLPNGQPYHVILVYSDINDGTWKVSQADIGNKVVFGQSFTDWIETNRSIFGTLTFNVIDGSVNDFNFGRSPDFMDRLKDGISRLRN